MVGDMVGGMVVTLGVTVVVALGGTKNTFDALGSMVSLTSGWLLSYNDALL